MGCSKKGCCDNTSTGIEKEFHGKYIPEIDSCSEGCCSASSERKRLPGNAGQHGPAIYIETNPNRHEEKKCGTGVRVLPTAHHNTRNQTREDYCHPKDILNYSVTEGKSVTVTSDSIQVINIESTNPKIDKVDAEKALYGVKHIWVHVQGMDCTSCEKKLYRSLTSLVELSNVKTSLLLAQAEFDLRSSNRIDDSNIASTIEKMTGFTCTKISHAGAELILFFSKNTQDLTDSWPSGVLDLTIISKNSVRVTYHPKLIGARELLLDPFFRYAQLAPPSASPLIASGRAHLLNTCWMTLLSSLLTIPVLVFTWANLPRRKVLYGAISLVLATVIQTVVAGPFYIRALNALIFSRMIDMDLLIVLSSSTAYIYSVVAYAFVAVGKPLQTDEIFQTSTLLVTLIMVGRMVTAFARQRAVESIAIESLQTPTAILVDPQSLEETEIDARLLQYNDTFKVLPETSVVTDGVVLAGESEVDESMITGEATLIAKEPGMSVVAGSINHSGGLVVRVSRLPYENTIKTIGCMVEHAKSSKPKVQELADRVASCFVPAILAISLAVFVIWVGVGMAVRHRRATVACINAMTFSISVLIVSCPCAIGLAVPMVFLIAGGVGARNGLVFKTAETIDVARKVSHVVFDKTGTLTQGNLYVVAEEYQDGNRNSLCSMILGLTASSKHPVSKAIAAHLSSSGTQASTVDHVVSVPGNGIKASWNGFTVCAGSPHWLDVQDAPEVRKVLPLGLTMFCVTLNNELVAILGLKDSLRPDAFETITELKKRRIDISIISGDHEAAVHSIAAQLSIPESSVRARCSPEQKQAYIKSLLGPTPNHEYTHSTSAHTHQQPRHKTPIILFCGDGTNDAPALAQASIGLHLNTSSSDVASSAADAILMRPSLHGVLTLIDLSKAFHRRVMFNFAWSAVYNLVAVLLAAGALPGARIPPAYAGLGEVVSVVPVVCVAVGLRFWRE